MSTQVTLPDPDKEVGDPNPPGDMNSVIIALNAMSATFWVYPTGDETGDDDTANFAAAVTALGSAPGAVYVGAGTYYLNGETGPLATNQWVVCAPGVFISWLGTGDCFRFVDTSTYDDRTVSGGGIIGRPIIDGTSAGTGSAGVHLGDILALRYDVAVQNFSGTDDIGVHFDNQNYWTEESAGRIWATNCTRHVVFDVSGEDTSTNSFGYTDIAIEVLAKDNQDGVVCQNGALLYNSSVKIKGNFQGASSSQSSAVLRLTGDVPAGHPNAGGYSAVHSCRLDIHAECSDALGSDAPYTIYFGTLSGNTLLGCQGILDFAQGSLAFQVSNWTAAGAAGTFGYDGVIRGDFNLNNATVGLSATYNASATAGAKTYGKSLLSGTSGNMQVNNGDFFDLTLSEDITVSLNPGSAAAFAAGQRKTVILSQPSTGGTYDYTVTWPKPGTAATTNCAIYWPGGSAPTMTTGAGATDRYELATYDGAHWYGAAYQANS